MDPSESVVACLFQHDVQYDFGIVLNSDGRVYQFGFDYLGRGLEEGVFSELEDIT
jgi:hypothetical protein